MESVSQRQSTNLDPLNFLQNGGQMGEVIRAKDWSKTPLGPIESWSQSLRTTISLALASNFPISLAWGPEFTQIYWVLLLPLKCLFLFNSQQNQQRSMSKK